jgi:hypothetical protein
MHGLDHVAGEAADRQGGGIADRLGDRQEHGMAHAQDG